MPHHYPSGTNPYFSCGYDRIPFNPADGDRVSIRCVPPEGTGEPVLRLRAGDNECTLSGMPDADTAKNCMLFHAGPFRARERVEYSFSFAPEDRYRFTVRSRVSLKECAALFQDGAALSARCMLDDGIAFMLRFTPEGEGFRMEAGQEPACAAAAVADNAALQTADGYRLLVSRTPFAVTVLSPGGGRLLQFHEDRHRATVELEDGCVRNVVFSCEAAGRGFYGCGEKFDRVNQRGLSPRNIVYEHYTHQGEHTYLPVPWLFTEQGWGLFIESGCETAFDLSAPDDGETVLEYRCEVGPDGFAPVHLLFGVPGELLRGLHRLTGASALPPEWAFGPWMSANGWNTQDEAMEQVRRMKELDIPATVLVLEAWSDETTFYIWNGANCTPKAGGAFGYDDFSFDPKGPWPNPKVFGQTLEDTGLHLVLWQIPVLKNAAVNNSAQLAVDEREAIERGYCVRCADGTPYRLPDRWFTGSLLLDFTNPEAVDWWLAKRRYLLDELHVGGFKTDGGEFVYDPALRFYNGMTGAQMRNRYPVFYTQAYFDFVTKGGRDGVTFSRAGYAGSQRCPMHWAGDQLSTFDELRSQLTAGLSAGLSGIPFWGFDIAGFAGELPGTELYLRAAALAAFSPVMQFHSEPRSGQYGDSRRRDWVNDRSPWNMARVNQAPEIIDIYRRYAKLRMKMLPYIYTEARNSAATARPMLCHLVLDYWDDPAVIDLEDEFLFGRSLLVAPVLNEGASGREVYLPAGDWYDFWTGAPYEGGRLYEVSCPAGEIPVFSRDREFIATTLMQEQ